MQKDVIAGACIAFIALLAPLGLVAVEGTTRAINHREHRLSNQAARLEQLMQTESSQASAETSISETTGDPAHADEIASPPEFVQYAALVDDADDDSTTRVVTVASNQVTSTQNAYDDQISVAFEQELAQHRHQDSLAAMTALDREHAAIRNARCQIKLLKPTQSVVQAVDGVLGRSAQVGAPVVLVHPLETDAGWFVQETTRQGAYFRALTRFGQRDTPDGSRFIVVVAFVSCEDDLPQVGTQLSSLPTTWIVSQPVDVTLRRQ